MTDVATREPSIHPRNLNRPYVRVKLIHDLAAGMGVVAAGEKYHVNPSSITRFADRYAVEIAEQAADLENRFAQLWIADKGARLAILQRDAELCAREVDSLRQEIRDNRLNGAEPADTAPLRTALAASRSGLHSALKLAGMELGAHRQVVDVNVTSVRYEVVGVDTEMLR